LRHGGEVYSVAFSPNSKVLASAGTGPRLCLWDVTSGKALSPDIQPQNQLKSVDFSADGKLLIGVSLFAHGIYIWEVASGKLVRQFGDLPHVGSMLDVDAANEVRASRLSPDSLTLASASHKVRLWDLATGRVQTTLPLSGNWPFPIFAVFAPDGKTLACGGNGAALSLWDPVLGRRLRQFVGHAEQVLCVAFTPDGKNLASAGKDRTIRLWDVATGRSLRQLNGHHEPIRSLAITADGKMLASASAEAICLWELPSGRKVHQLTGHAGGIRSIALSPDSRLLAAGSHNGTISIWEVSTAKTVQPFWGHQDRIEAAAFSPDGQSIASGGADTILLWDAATGDLRRRFPPEAHGTLALAFSPDGKTLATGHADRTPRLWDLSANKEPQSFGGGPEHSASLTYSPDGKLLASADQRFGLSGKTPDDLGLDCLWDVSTGRLLRRFGTRRRAENFSYTTFVTFSPMGQVLALGGINQPVRIWNVPRGHQPRQLTADSASAGAFSPGGKILAVADRDILCYDVTTGQRLIRLAGPPQQVRTIAFAPDGKSLVSGGDDATVRLWELATGEERHVFRGHQAGVTAVAFSPDGDTIASASRDTTLLLWDAFGSKTKEWSRPTGPKRQAMPALWGELAGETSRADAAMRRMLQTPEQSVSWLKGHLQAVPSLTPEQMARLTVELDSDSFSLRTHAWAQLEVQGRAAEPALRKALAANPTLEVRRRMENLLDRLDVARCPERLRAWRSLEILEHVGTRQARQLLQAIASGAPEAELTQEAKACLQRLARRSAPSP
jgi:WD40 repeat protein